MFMNHHPPRYEEPSGPAASLGRHESQQPWRRYVTDSHKDLPANGPVAAPPRTPTVDDTPLYWQTVQAMASRRWRRDG